MAQRTSNNRNSASLGMSIFPHTTVEIEPTRIAVIVLQSDETIERDMIALRGELICFLPVFQVAGK